jgi:hypothetical protein
MENTKEFISYNVVIYKEFIHNADSCHKTFSEAKQAIADKLVSIANNDKMTDDNKAYWSEKYNNAIIVESISKYTIVK